MFKKIKALDVGSSPQAPRWESWWRVVYQGLCETVKECWINGASVSRSSVRGT